MIPSMKMSKDPSGYSVYFSNRSKMITPTHIIEKRALLDAHGFFLGNLEAFMPLCLHATQVKSKGNENKQIIRTYQVRNINGL